MNAEDLTGMREICDAMADKMVKQYVMQVADLTEKQLVSAFSQALQSGDFQKQCGFSPDGRTGQSITYIPGREADRLRRLYNELLHAVESKHEGETRHETALRYIREREQQPGGPSKES